MSSKHHLVVFANFARDNGFTLCEAIEFLANEDVSPELFNAYEDTYLELMQFVNTQTS